MAQLLREIFASAAQGNCVSHVARLVQLRAYGNHTSEHVWHETLGALKRDISKLTHVDASWVGACREHGDHYASFMTEGFGLVSASLDDFDTAYVVLFGPRHRGNS